MIVLLNVTQYYKIQDDCKNSINTMKDDIQYILNAIFCNKIDENGYSNASEMYQQYF